MKVGIVGLQSCGKTTLFRALTRGKVKTEDNYGNGRPNIGVVSVPDRRIDYFARQYNPKKVTYAHIEFIDGAAQVAKDDGKNKFGSDFFSDVRQVDMLVHVVRGFTSNTGDAPSPMNDVQALNDELALSDLQVIENRMMRVEKQLHGVKKGVTTPATQEMDVLERLKSALEEAKPMSEVQLTPEEKKAISSYDFLTLKAMVIVLNIPESEIASPSETTLKFRQYCAEAGLPESELCAEVEMEVSELADEEEAEFLESIGIKEPARNVLIRECYKELGLISFITAGEPEVRAWTLRAGSKAVEAAGTIHSDLARGFIRAEVANFKEIEAVGSWEIAKQQNAIQLVGKDHIIQDGDVMYIRFKV